MDINMIKGTSIAVALLAMVGVAFYSLGVVVKEAQDRMKYENNTREHIVSVLNVSPEGVVLKTDITVTGRITDKRRQRIRDAASEMTVDELIANPHKLSEHLRNFYMIPVTGITNTKDPTETVCDHNQCRLVPLVRE